jgi:quercetin dioxygenase-like cupin family protein
LWKGLGGGVGLGSIAALLTIAGFIAAHPVEHAAHVHASVTPEQARMSATVVSEEVLAHVPGKKVTVEIVHAPPGSSVPEHHHGGSVTVYVLSGTLRSRLAGGPLLDYEKGETFFEPPGAVHVVTANPSATEPAEFMAIHVLDEGAPLTTYH